MGEKWRQAKSTTTEWKSFHLLVINLVVFKYRPVNQNFWDKQFTLDHFWLSCPRISNWRQDKRTKAGLWISISFKSLALAIAISLENNRHYVPFNETIFKMLGVTKRSQHLQKMIFESNLTSHRDCHLPLTVSFRQGKHFYFQNVG